MGNADVTQSRVIPGMHQASNAFSVLTACKGQGPRRKSLGPCSPGTDPTQQQERHLSLEPMPQPPGRSHTPAVETGAWVPAITGPELHTARSCFFQITGELRSARGWAGTAMYPEAGRAHAGAGVKTQVPSSCLSPQLVFPGPSA